MTKVMIALAMLMAGVLTLGMSQQAVADNDAFTLYERGLDQLNGTNGVQRDVAAAVVSLTELAERGWAIAQYKLGEIYHQGNGVERSRVEAYKWYAQAAEQNFPPAKERLVELMEEMDYWERESVSRLSATSIGFGESEA